MTATKIKAWRLGAHQDRRFRSGHPWVYSNELQSSPKGIEPGELVELQDAGGAFLARGMGNPHSLIAFRAISRDPEETEPLSQASIEKKLRSALHLREQSGIAKCSHRLCFGEADGLPGLVIDRYRSAEEDFLVIQAHTAGMDRVLDVIQAALRSVLPQVLTVILRNDLSVRKLEGIEEQAPKVLGPERDLSNIEIQMASASGAAPVSFTVDLVGGQKTGFFLDQSANIRMVVENWRPARKDGAPNKIRILDLCCYVGQWGAQLAQAYIAQGFEVEVVGFDASAAALERSAQNVRRVGGRFESVQGDILEDLSKMPAQSFDVVISDPPALIKGRKNIPQGTHAYLQLNTQAIRLTRPQGAVVCCSCSMLMEEDEFLRVLAKAASRNKHTVRWTARGGHAPDHPVLAEFPEGRYLKAWLGCLAH